MNLKQLAAIRFIEQVKQIKDENVYYKAEDLIADSDKVEVMNWYTWGYLLIYVLDGFKDINWTWIGGSGLFE